MIELRLSPSGSGFEATMPSGHQITLPADDRTAVLLNRILSAQGAGRSKLGMEGSPTQGMVRDWLQGHTPRRFDERGAKAKIEAPSLAELGLL